MRNMEGVFLGGALSLGLVFSQGVQAQDCSMAKWNGAAPTVPAAAVGTPQSASPVARYSEFCGLAVSATGYVQTPATSDTQYFGRFYVFPQAVTGTVDLLVAYSDTSGASPLFKISYDGTNFLFDATAASGGTGSAPANANLWNLVEFEFNSDGNFNVWVNEDWDFGTTAYVSGPSDTFASGSGTVASVRLGAPNGFTSGKVTYDAFEAHRTTNVGSLIDCDADGSGSPVLNLNDVIAVISEAFSPNTLASGQPDCDKNGSMNLNDVISTIQIAFP